MVRLPGRLAYPSYARRDPGITSPCCCARVRYQSHHQGHSHCQEVDAGTVGLGNMCMSLPPTTVVSLTNRPPTVHDVLWVWLPRKVICGLLVCCIFADLKITVEVMLDKLIAVDKVSAFGTLDTTLSLFQQYV